MLAAAHSSLLGELLATLSYGRATAEILQRNVESGRAQRVCQARSLTLEQYAIQINSSYATHHEQVIALEQGQRESWDQLWQLLFRRAEALLRAYGWPPDQAHSRAQEATQEACLSIACHIFPYDCPFEPWAYTILQRHLYRGRSRAHGPLDKPGRSVPLSEPDGAEPGVPDASSQVEAWDAVREAMRHLRSPAQRQVIELLIFDDQSVHEAARLMGRSVQAIYNLKHAALAILRAHLTLEEPGGSS